MQVKRSGRVLDELYEVGYCLINYWNNASIRYFTLINYILLINYFKLLLISIIRIIIKDNMQYLITIKKTLIRKNIFIFIIFLLKKNTYDLFRNVIINLKLV